MSIFRKCLSFRRRRVKVLLASTTIIAAAAYEFHLSEQNHKDLCKFLFNHREYAYSAAQLNSDLLKLVPQSDLGEL